MSTENTPESDKVEVAFSLDDWIAGVSPTQRSVQIYGRTDVFGRYEAIQREIGILETVNASEEASITDQENLAGLYAEREDLYHQQQASKTTWYVQALDQAVIAAVTAEHPIPDALVAPVEPPARAPQSLRDQYNAEMKRYQAKLGKHEQKRSLAMDETNLHMIAAALVRIENHEGATVATSITVDQLRALAAKPHGQLQVGSLLTAVFQAKASEPVIPAPFSQQNSGNARV